MSIKEKEETKHARRFTIILPRELRKQAHIKAAQENTKLSYVLIKYLEKWTNYGR